MRGARAQAQSRHAEHARYLNIFILVPVVLPLAVSSEPTRAVSGPGVADSPTLKATSGMRDGAGALPMGGAKVFAVIVLVWRLFVLARLRGPTALRRDGLVWCVWRG